MMVDHMEITQLIVEALKFIFPAYCANATLVLAGGGTLMDFGRTSMENESLETTKLSGASFSA